MLLLVLAFSTTFTIASGTNKIKRMGASNTQLFDEGWRFSRFGMQPDGTHWKRRLPTVAMLSATAIGEYYLRPVDY